MFNDNPHNRGYERTFRDADELVKWYERHRFFHVRLAHLVEQYLRMQIESYFHDHDVRLPVVARMRNRAKEMNSLIRNLQVDRYLPKDGPPVGSNSINRDRIQDLAGVRAVFYFESHVDEFCKHLKSSVPHLFGIHAKETLEQRKPDLYDPKRLEYRSWHFNVHVQPGNEFYSCLNEMDKGFLCDLYCEVQLRTILQEAWAETEHDIVYKFDKKSMNSVLEDIIEGFYSLSTILHSADVTLDSLKGKYESIKPKDEAVPPAQRHWHYNETDISGAEVYNGVEYSYQVLHRPRPADGLKQPFSIVSHPVLFDIDERMSQFTGKRSYKEQVWGKLQREEPEFIAAIDHDSTVVRVTDWNEETRALTVQLAAYSDQVVTNHQKAHAKSVPGTPDKRIASLAFRSDTRDEKGRKLLLPFPESPLSNTLGIASVIFTVDQRWLIALRSATVAFDPNKWGCSASGALNWIELGQWRTRDFDSWIKNGIIREVEEELGYTPQVREVHYLGLAREFGRLGKPQVFFLIKAHQSSTQLIATFRTYRQSNSEYLALKDVTRSQAKQLVGKNEGHVYAICGEANVGEELRFNLYLALRYLNEEL